MHTDNARSRRVFMLCLLSALLLAVLVPLSTSIAAPPGRVFLIIVHPSNPQRSITREQLMRAYFKRTTRWESGTPIRPVDLSPDSPTRRAFSDQVLKRSVVAVRTYWQQRIFSGRELPPPELESDAAVMHFVQNSPGSIGYVAAHTQLSGVHVIPISDAPVELSLSHLRVEAGRQTSTTFPLGAHAADSD